MKIAVLGPKGTFSDKAYLEYAKQHKDIEFEAEYYSSIDEVFSAVSPGDCAMGIVPVENTLDGYVQRTLDLLLEKDLQIVDENMVEVQFSLLGNVSSREEIEKLYVQFKANGQCRQFINSLEGAKIISTESNMESFYRLENEKGSAAIVPKHIVESVQDKFIIENVTDAGNNHTRFFAIKKGNVNSDRVVEFKAMNDKAEYEGKVRIPVYIMPTTERPGVLFEILKNFNDREINMISIMSRPTKHELGTYNFYIEIDGMYSQLDTIMETLRKIHEFNDIKILGIYNEQL